MGLIGRIFQNKLVVILAAAAVMAIGVVGVASADTGRDNSDNAIMRGGAGDPKEFISNLKDGNSDMRAIYSNYGLSSGDYNKFRDNAEMGVAYRNGDIKVGGDVVAHNAKSLGRNQQDYTSTVSINGNKYYESDNQDVFLSDSIPIMVLFDSNDNFKFGVLTSCGNPVKATPVHKVKPVQQSATCDLLQKQTVSGQANTYDFTTKATLDNMRVTKVTYDFGDGSATETRTSASEAVRHTFANPGTYHTKVTLYAKDDNSSNNSNEQAYTSANCATDITVQAPPAPTPQPPVTPTAATLPATGVGDFAGLFIAVSAAGALGYYIYLKRQLARQ